MCPGLTIHYDTGMSYCSTLNFRGKSGQPSVKPLKSGLKMWKRGAKKSSKEPVRPLEASLLVGSWRPLAFPPAAHRPPLLLL